MAGLIACKDARLCAAFSCPWLLPSTVYKLLEIERRKFDILGPHLAAAVMERHAFAEMETPGLAPVQDFPPLSEERSQGTCL